MFDHPGEKIKNFAKFLTVFLLVGGFVAALVLAVVMRDPAFFFLIFISSAITGVLTGLFFYGFGTLIESSEANEKNTREILTILNRGGASDFVPAPAAPAPAAPNAGQPANGQAPVEPPVPAPAPAPAAKEQTPASSPASGAPESGVRLANGWWRCVCGTENAPYVSSCSCGRRKRDVIK